MYAIKSIYGSKYIKGIDLSGDVIDSKGEYTSRHIILYCDKTYLQFKTEEDAWIYINKHEETLLNTTKYKLEKKYNKQNDGSFKRVFNSITNLCAVEDNGLEYHGKNSEDDIERFKWCKLRKYSYFK